MSGARKKARPVSTRDVAPSTSGVSMDHTLVGPLWEGTTRAEDAQGTPTQSHVSPSILVYEHIQPSASDEPRSTTNEEPATSDMVI